MHRQHKTTLFMFSALEYQEMEEYLEEMATRGWLLEQFGPLSARFRRIEPINLRFAVVVFPENREVEYVAQPEWGQTASVLEDLKFRQWEFLASTPRFAVFCIESHKNPPALQSEATVRQKILDQPPWNQEMVVFVAALPVWILSVRAVLPIDYNHLLTNTGLVSLFYLPLLLVPLLLYAGHYAGRMILARKKAKAGVNVPRGSFRRVQVRSYLVAGLGSIACLLAVMALLFDFLTVYGTGLLIVFLSVLVGVTRWGLGKLPEASVPSPTYRMIIMTGAIIVGGVLFLTLGMKLSAPWAAPAGPEGAPVLTLTDLGVLQPAESILVSDSGSILVPRYVDYGEMGTEVVIRTRYLQTINPAVAHFVFRRILIQETAPAYRVAHEANQKWSLDGAYYLNDDFTMVLLWSDNRVWLMDSHLDLSARKQVERIKAELQL